MAHGHHGVAVVSEDVEDSHGILLQGIPHMDELQLVLQIDWLMIWSASLWNQLLASTNNILYFTRSKEADAREIS